MHTTLYAESGKLIATVDEGGHLHEHKVRNECSNDILTILLNTRIQSDRWLK